MTEPDYTTDDTADDTPPAIRTLPPEAAPSVPEHQRHNGRGPNEPTGVLMGVTVALIVHLGVVGLSFRLGHDEGNVAAQPPAAPEQVIETHLMKRGGGLVDPRHVVHRETPVLAEREAPRAATPTRDPTAVTIDRDAGPEDYMAAITGRRVRGRGNQDLAERTALDRINALAAAESAADPTASGPGTSDGSNQGDTTDPNLATRGAPTKIDRFLREHIRISTALTGSEARTVTFRIRLDPTGAIVLAEMATPSGNASLDGDILGQARRLADDHARITDLTPEECTALAGRNINVRVPIDRMSH